MIPLDRMEKLNAIGFQWRVGNQFVGWDLKFKELVQFKDRSVSMMRCNRKRHRFANRNVDLTTFFLIPSLATDLDTAKFHRGGKKM